MPDLPQPTDGPSIATAPSEEAQLGSTTDTGAPAPSDRNSLTLGPDGPILLHDVHFLNQMAHFNRERVPERNVHAKGVGRVRRVRDHRGRLARTPRPRCSSPASRPRCWPASPPWPASRARPTRGATRAASR